MNARQNGALFQAFLPDRKERAFVWKYAKSTGGRRPRHFHGEPELNLVARGSALFGVGRRVIRAAAGDLVAFPAGQDHVLLEGSADLYLYALGLDRALSAEALGTGSEPLVPFHVRLTASEARAAIDKAATLVDRKNAASLGAELWAELHWLGCRATANASLRPHVLTRRSLQLLSRAPELALEALAKELRAQPSEVSRHFHADLGMTFVRYRARLRLMQLIDGVDAGQDLMSAAGAAGFGSYSQCHRTFGAELGCAPREFFSGVRGQMQSAYDP